MNENTIIISRLLVVLLGVLFIFRRELPARSLQLNQKLVFVSVVALVVVLLWMNRYEYYGRGGESSSMIRCNRFTGAVHLVPAKRQ